MIGTHPVLRLRKGKVHFEITSKPSGEQGFDLFIEKDGSSILVGQPKDFESMMQDMDALAVVFGVLGYKIKHTL